VYILSIPKRRLNLISFFVFFFLFPSCVNSTSFQCLHKCFMIIKEKMKRNHFEYVTVSIRPHPTLCLFICMQAISICKCFVHVYNTARPSLPSPVRFCGIFYPLISLAPRGTRGSKQERKFPII
jgi:hypothetical protein